MFPMNHPIRDGYARSRARSTADHEAAHARA